ncbi:trypsin inhibitor-like cysteine-rich domain-containing protein [uncultured Tenacibaculum sp.]|uniref:trypsin inhibitor-like cysteine-rich domain-containing protein n=1 Tax=uncultured Tenacibaculum sp. TaxID=174713 RepID=UPI002637489B|nr:trypsin inhibitor-like cysteine-rich domain-containing protein [uncultured Tenacibaculum sp.]
MKRKNKLSNLLKTGILFFGISLLLWNCENQEDIKIESNTHNKFLYKTVSSDDILNFKKEYNLAKKTKDKLNLKLDFSNIKQEKIKNTSEFVTTIPAKTKHKNINTKVILVKQHNSLIKILINTIPNENMSSNKFSGIVSITHLNGKFINGYRLKDGLFTTQFVKTQKNRASFKFDAPDEGDCDESLNPDSDFCDNNLDEVVINSGSGGGSFTISITIGSDTGPVNYGFGSSTGGGGSGSSYSGSSTNVLIFPCNDPVHGCDKEECEPGFYKDDDGNCVEEDQIINKLTGKAKCVYEKLKALNLFKATIKKFENSNNYNLVIEQNNSCSSGIDACTDGKDVKNGNIKINIRITPDHQPLYYASTLLHEGIHAELFKYVDEHQKGIDPNNRKNLLKWYFSYKGDEFQSEFAQHQHMADKYVKPIAMAIRKLDNYSYPLEYYMGFGWDGLTKYGYDGYYDNGKWVSLDKSLTSQYNIKQKIVNDNTKLNGNECK